jgi:hypothetical protein
MPEEARPEAHSTNMTDTAARIVRQLTQIEMLLPELSELASGVAIQPVKNNKHSGDDLHDA